MGTFSNYAENKILDHVLKVASFTVPTNLAISLHTADPTDAGTGAEVANSNNYARVVCNTWDVAASRATANTNAIVFPQASGAWGIVTHFGIWDSATYGAGNLIGHGALSSSKNIVSGNILTIPAGSLDVSITTGGMSTYLANELLDHVFKVGAYTVPTNIYVALSTADPTDDGSGIAEPSGNNYARVNNNTWDIAASGATANTGAITTATASGSWGTISHTFISDASTAGNMLFYSTISPSQAVTTDEYMEFAAGGYDITLD